MKWFYDLKTGVKLVGGFLIVALIVVAVALVGYFNMSGIRTDLDTLYHDAMLSSQLVADAYAALLTARGEVYKFIVVADERDQLEKNVRDGWQTVSQKMDEYRAGQHTEDGRAELKTFDQEWAVYQQVVGEVLADVRAGRLEKAMQSLAEGGATANSSLALRASLARLTEINQRVAEELYNEGDATFASSVRLFIIVTAVAVLLAIGLGVFISRSITVPLSIMAGALQNLAKGDLNRDIPQSVKDQIMARNDEIGTAGKGLGQTEIYLTGMAEVATRIAQGDLSVEVRPNSAKDELGNAFATMVANLRRLIGQVSESATAVNSASDQLAAAANQAGQATSQIAATIQQVAKGTAQQTEGVTKTAASVEQMARAIDGVARGAQEQAGAVAKVSTVTGQITSAIQQVVTSAQAGAKGSAEAAQAARSGVHTVEETIQGMTSIKAKVDFSAEKVKEMGRRSDQIGAIVETIDDIASQTNLLALNAAIEAARAGEHGKGFAVVADEVRKLAEKATGATKEIADLIRDIQQTIVEAVQAMDEGAREVEHGVGRANQAGGALDDILRVVETVNRQVQDIAEAAQRMERASAELITASETVSAVVEENTAATEEMAANSSEVREAIESIASVSEENSAAVEEVSAAAEEMSAQVEEVTASAQSLADMARSLQAVVVQFKL